MIGAILGGVASLIASGITNSTNKSIANQNLDFQKEQQAWDREKTKEMWERDDNAVQRRAADLQAAGLSPTLAAGGGAESSAPISSQAPQNEYRPNYAQDIAQALGIAQSVEQIKLTKAQTDKIIADQMLDRDKFNQNKTEFEKGHLLEQEKLIESQRKTDLEIGLGNANLNQRQQENRDKLAMFAEQMGENKYEFKQNLEIAMAKLALEKNQFDVYAGYRGQEVVVSKQYLELARNKKVSQDAVREVYKALEEMRTKILEKDLETYDYRLMMDTTNSLMRTLSPLMWGLAY